MADHSLFDNTQAQEQQTEALQAATRAIEDLAQTLEEQARDYAARRFQQEGASAPTPEAVSFAAMAQAAKQLGHQGLAQVYGKNFSDALNAAKSASAPVAPTTPPPPQENYYQAYLREKREQAQVNAPPPPPPQTPPPPANNPAPPTEEASPPPEEEERPRYLSHDLFKQYMQHREEAEGPKLTRTVNELNRRMEALAEVYRQGASPGDIAAQGLRRSVREQENYLAQQYAGLSPEEQQQHAPLMQGVEQQRKRLEEEELRRRREMNQELSTGAHALQGFVRGLPGGGGFGMSGGGVDSLASLFAHALTRDYQHVQHASQIAYPSLAQQQKGADQLADIEYANQEGGREALLANVNMTRSAAAARRQGAVGSWNDPENYRSVANPLLTTFYAEAIGRGAYGFLASGGNPAAYRENADKTWQRYYESRIRGVGGEVPNSAEQLPMNIPGIQARVTSGEEYEMSIANAAIQSSGETPQLEVLRRQLELLQQWLPRISTNTGNASPPAFGD